MNSLSHPVIEMNEYKLHIERLGKERDALKSRREIAPNYTAGKDKRARIVQKTLSGWIYRAIEKVYVEDRKVKWLQPLQNRKHIRTGSVRPQDLSAMGCKVIYQQECKQDVVFRDKDAFTRELLIVGQSCLLHFSGRRRLSGSLASDLRLHNLNRTTIVEDALAVLSETVPREEAARLSAPAPVASGGDHGA